ncbi:hypothetical protein H4582DRAFT_2078622 [Lactarius indigo]|nr:hypothetical protein H4582DRAFT_2078622 [Lactarius indigo]
MSTSEVPSGDEISGDSLTPKAIEAIEKQRVHAANMGVIHEATLEDLLHCRNCTVFRILAEHNELLRECIKLGTKEIEYSEFDYLDRPPGPPRPYAIVTDIGILWYYTKKPSWARYPQDRRVFHKGVQTIDQDTDPDPDTTLADVDPKILVESSNTQNKKRKLM